MIPLTGEYYRYMNEYHQHKWKVHAICGRDIRFGCELDTCGEEATRSMTDREWKQYLKDSEKEGMGIHALWHDFLKKGPRKEIT